MRSALATLCLALALAGCRGTGTGNGLFGQMTIPPPGTQPPGALLAGNSYYPAASPTTSNPPSAAAPDAPATPAFLSTFNPPAGTNFLSTTTPPSSTAASDSTLTDRRGASLSRANLAGPARSPTSVVREEPILIPSDSPNSGKLATVIPIRGIPTTDATGQFERIRSQLSTPTSLAVQPRAPSGFVEISQLPNPPADLRRAALFQQQLR